MYDPFATGAKLKKAAEKKAQKALQPPPVKATLPPPPPLPPIGGAGGSETGSETGKDRKEAPPESKVKVIAVSIGPGGKKVLMEIGGKLMELPAGASVKTGEDQEVKVTEVTDKYVEFIENGIKRRVGL